MKKPKKPRAQDKQDGDEGLSFDPTTLPAAVDFHAFARRTGEIIARAARALLGNDRVRPDWRPWSGPLLNSGSSKEHSVFG